MPATSPRGRAASGGGCSSEPADNGLGRRRPAREGRPFVMNKVRGGSDTPPLGDKKDLRRLLRGLPKVELHRHSEGALPLRTLWEFHERAGLTLFPDYETFRRLIVVSDGEAPGFAEFLARFRFLYFYYGGPEAVARLGREIVTAAGADGVAHLEFRFSPVFWGRRLRPDDPAAASLRELLRRTDLNAILSGALPLAALPPLVPGEPPSLAVVEEAVEALTAGATAAAKEHGLSLVFICSLGRDYGLEGNRPALELLLSRPLGSLFAGVDVAGDEGISPASLAGVLTELRRKGYRLTIHAGEAGSGETGAANVREAVRRFGAERIGHGVAAATSPPTLKLLRERGTALEVCPTSNVQTGAAVSFAAHPLKKLLRAGAKASINTDDPTLSAVSSTEEYARAVERCGLDLEEVAACAVNGARAAFLPEERRRELLAVLKEAWERVLP